jgi:hypothetical protein
MGNLVFKLEALLFEIFEDLVGGWLFLGLDPEDLAINRV